jgi:dTDP-4-amino-4,6-dideoxygalactose transaminase
MIHTFDEEGFTGQTQRRVPWIPSKHIDFGNVEDLLQESLKDNQFTNYGPAVRHLERVIRELFHIDDEKAVIAVTNGSVALHSLTSSIEYFHGKSMTWATQCFTFPPSAQGTLAENTLIVDIERDHYGLDLESIDTAAIDGIILTNIFGNVVDIEKYTTWATTHQKIILYDNAATAYSFYHGKNVLNYGTGCTISFHHTKPFGFGEGGAIIVDRHYENTIRCMNNFGIGLSVDTYCYRRGGNNYKMSDVSAAFILQFIQRQFHVICTQHTSLYRYCQEKIIPLTDVLYLFPNYADEDQPIVVSCLTFYVRVHQTRERILEKLDSLHIACRKYYHPLDNGCTEALSLFEHILCVPCTTEMTLRDIDRILYAIATL